MGHWLCGTFDLKMFQVSETICDLSFVLLALDLFFSSSMSKFIEGHDKLFIALIVEVHCL